MIFRDTEYSRRIDRDQAVATRTRALAARLTAPPPPPPRSCCWPLWTGDTPAAERRFCGDAIVAGQVYCAEHAARAYWRPSR